VVGLRDGRRLDVTVLDRDRQVAGLVYRIWRRLRLHTESRHRDPVAAAELKREALMAYAAHAAGANIPEALVTRHLDPLFPVWQAPLGAPSRMRMPGRRRYRPR
jgi:hypothetical protein